MGNTLGLKEAWNRSGNERDHNGDCVQENVLEKIGNLIQSHSRRIASAARRTEISALEWVFAQVSVWARRLIFTQCMS